MYKPLSAPSFSRAIGRSSIFFTIACVIASIRCARLGVEVRQAAEGFLQLADADLLRPLAQRRDDRHDVQRVPPLLEGSDFLADDRLHLLDFRLAAAPALVRHRFDVVDVAEVYARDRAHVRVDVARHGDVDEQQPAAVSLRHHRHDVRRVRG